MLFHLGRSALKSDEHKIVATAYDKEELELVTKDGIVCGCSVVDFNVWNQCSMHKATPEMLKVLEWIVKALEAANPTDAYLSGIKYQAEQVLASVKKKHDHKIT